MPDQEQMKAAVDDISEVARGLKRIEQEKRLEMQAKQLPEDGKVYGPFPNKPVELDAAVDETDRQLQNDQEYQKQLLLQNARRRAKLQQHLQQLQQVLQKVPDMYVHPTVTDTKINFRVRGDRRYLLMHDLLENPLLKDFVSKHKDYFDYDAAYDELVYKGDVAASKLVVRSNAA